MHLFIAAFEERILAGEQIDRQEMFRLARADRAQILLLAGLCDFNQGEVCWGKD